MLKRGQFCLWFPVMIVSEGGSGQRGGIKGHVLLVDEVREMTTQTHLISRSLLAMIDGHVYSFRGRRGKIPCSKCHATLKFRLIPIVLRPAARSKHLS